MNNAMDQHLEIEVKFFIDDVKTILNKITALGGKSKGRVFETNIRYEDDMCTLKARRSLLRLRKDHQVRLTVKQDPDRQNREFKILRELEVGVSDFETMDKILAALGFHQEQVYEKWRETILFNDVMLCLDTLPFGNFLEIEGSQSEIRAAADALGLEWDRRILSNYLEIFSFLKKEAGLGFNDITFKNFKNHSIQFQPYRQIFEARTRHPTIPK
jgi:adenylate cyclase, class 2